MKFSTLIKLSILSGAMVLLQGCIPATIIGTTAVATKIATDPRTTGTQIDDEIMEEKIAHNLHKDPQLSEEARINVVSYNGKVLLVGQSLNESGKDLAKNIALGVEGVVANNVYNEIRIGNKIPFIQVTKDAWITTQAKSKLFVNSGVKATDIKVITENGEVFLLGKLSQTQANKAVEVVRNIRGVQKVIKVIEYLQ